MSSCRPFAIPLHLVLPICFMTCLALAAYPGPADGQQGVPQAMLAEPPTPATPVPTQGPNLDCTPFDCGGYSDCSCHVCCPNSAQPCLEATSNSALRLPSTPVAAKLRATLVIPAQGHQSQ